MTASRIYVHLVSDSTGDTLSSVSKAVFAQFDHIEVRQYLWALIQTKSQLDKVISVIGRRKGIVMYTIVNEKNAELLRDACKKHNIPCIEVLRNIVDVVSHHLKKEPNPDSKKQHAIDEEYFNRIEAINFTIAHDDGQHTESFRDVDIVIIGPSRTSKSPTSIYLAHKGFKTANIPFVMETDFPNELSNLKNVFIVGLSISPERLIDIRRNRLASMKEHKHTPYIDAEKVREEILVFKKLCVKNHWPIIDITNKSIEETAARIIQMYHSWRKSEKAKQ